MKKITLALMLLTVTALQAREYTKPPSVALRQEATYVAQVKLEDKQFKDPHWSLTLSTKQDLHNQSAAQITLQVTAQLADLLAANETYIVAYQTHKKTKVDGINRYLPLPEGPQLLSVQGADPAIFRTHPLLLKQLTADPKRAQDDTQALVQDIIQGLQSKDPKLTEFFVRELINWPGLINQLSANDQKHLLELFHGPDATVGSLIALLENRSAVHEFLGPDAMQDRVLGLLHQLPTELDPNSEIPTLVRQALEFVTIHQQANWSTISRWSRCNVPAITEQSLRILQQLDAEKTQQLVAQRLRETMISDASRRVLQRFLRN